MFIKVTLFLFFFWTYLGNAFAYAEVTTCSRDQVLTGVFQNYGYLYSSTKALIDAISRVENKFSCKFAPVECHGFGDIEFEHIGQDGARVYGQTILIDGKEVRWGPRLAKVVEAAGDNPHAVRAWRSFQVQKRMMNDLVQAGVCLPVKPRPCITRVIRDARTSGYTYYDFNDSPKKYANWYGFDDNLLNNPSDSSTYDFQYSKFNHNLLGVKNIYEPLNDGLSVAENLLNEGVCSVILNSAHFDEFTPKMLMFEGGLQSCGPNGDISISQNSSPPYYPTSRRISVILPPSPGRSRIDLNMMSYENSSHDNAMWIDHTTKKTHYSYLFFKGVVSNPTDSMSESKKFPTRARLDFITEIGKANEVTPLTFIGLQKELNPDDYDLDIQCK